ncbi:type I restriction-modification system subunit M [Gulosibacter chungangensis]|uniref:type I restriction-modification system subunit M n=1 Tax=Gulosibacter chungangensis TaxID=979746 RepID=UPI001CE3F81A|nr:class I SAM-dependent DNA methyltransferase [Gulosibacter chungangensis]
MVVALKKSDLYSSLWSSADELRGSMDASQYKDYVLTLLFVKYVSDKAKADPYALIEVPQDGSFDYLITLKGKPDVGEKVNVAIRKLAEANNLQGVINNADFDDPTKLGSGKDLQDRVSNLIGIFQDIDFTGSRAEGDDLLGDAYEYLMRHFATQSGKSKGQFYTPAEVSRVMSQLLQIPAGTPKSTTVYDPTCGSGSLLIKVADAAPNGLTIYGQENDNATWALARMNMILHGNETHEIVQGNTLADPKFREGDRLTTFDYLVANPPFSHKTWKNGFEKDYGRFDGFATPPDKNGDYAFLLHMVKSLKSTGRGAVILPHGVLFRGNSEAQIRKELIKRGYIKAIIGLPANLFYGTGIPACVLVLDKKSAANRTGIFMIDASKGFEKDGPKNRLRPRDMRKIIDAYLSQADIDRFSRFVPNSEIEDAKNDYNLNIPRYIDSSEPEDIQDLRAHLQGGIPNRDLDDLQLYWDAFPGLREELFSPLRDGYSELKISKAYIESTVLGFGQYAVISSETTDLVKSWWHANRAALEGIDGSTRPNDLSSDLGESLLESFRAHRLLDEYAVYEQLMSYWNASMHDDVALIVGEGWDAAAKPRTARTWKDKSNKTKYEDAHLTFGTGAKAKRWVMDLIPPNYIIERFFADEQAQLDQLAADFEAATQAVEEYTEEHAVEEGLLWEAVEDDKITATTVKNRLRAAKAERADPDEIKALNHVASLFAAGAAAKKAVKEATTKLEEQALAQYGKLTTDDIKQLVIDDKWGATIATGIESELVTAVQKFTARLRVLAERYETTVGHLDAEIEASSAKVVQHLASMGMYS